MGSAQKEAAPELLGEQRDGAGGEALGRYQERVYGATQA